MNGYGYGAVSLNFSLFLCASYFTAFLKPPVENCKPFCFIHLKVSKLDLYFVSSGKPVWHNGAFHTACFSLLC